MQVILLAAISADGKIAEQEDQTSLDWTSKEDTKFFVEKTKEAGVVIMGSKTFATIGKALRGRRLIVLSHQSIVGRDVFGPTDSSPSFPPTSRPNDGARHHQISPEGTVEFVNSSPNQVIKRLEKEGHDAVVVAGGASVYSQFLREKLVTDLYLTVEPVLFGQGIALASDCGRINLELLETMPLGAQAVVLHYRTSYE